MDFCFILRQIQQMTTDHRRKKKTTNNGHGVQITYDMK